MRTLRGLSGLSLGAGLLALGMGVGEAADLAAPKVLPAPVAAASTPIDYIFGYRIQTDYNFRGISQSDRRPSWQSYGELQFLENSFYLGYASYKVDLPTKPQYEIDLTGGWRPKYGPLTFDLGFIYYLYPDERRLVDIDTGVYFTPKNTDFLELAGRVSWAVSDQWTLGGSVFHAWDWLGSGASATYFSGTAKYVIPEGFLGAFGSGFSISGELGYYSLGTTSPQLGSVKLADYTYWNVGGAYTYKNFTVDLRYHDTDLGKADCFLNTTDPRGIATGSGRSHWCGPAFVATASLDFTYSQLGIFAPSK